MGNRRGPKVRADCKWNFGKNWNKQQIDWFDCWPFWWFAVTPQNRFGYVKWMFYSTLLRLRLGQAVHRSPYQLWILTLLTLLICRILIIYHIPSCSKCDFKELDRNDVLQLITSWGCLNMKYVCVGRQHVSRLQISLINIRKEDYVVFNISKGPTTDRTFRRMASGNWRDTVYRKLSWCLGKCYQRPGRQQHQNVSLIISID